MLYTDAITRFSQKLAIRAERASISYAECVTKLFIFSKKQQVEDVDDDDVVAFQLFLKRSKEDSTQRLYAVALRSFFDFATKRGWGNVKAEEIEVPRVMEKVPVYVVQSEFETLCDIAKDEPLKLLCIRLLWFTGVRVSELCDMKFTDLNCKERCAKIQAKKAFRPKMIFWDEETNNLIIQCAGSSHGEHIFSSQYGNKLTTRQIQRWIKELITKAGITKEITPHSFRHGFAHQNLDLGVDLPALQDFMGHSNPQSLFKYTKRLEEDIKEKGRDAIRKRMALGDVHQLAKDLHVEKLLKPHEYEQ